MASKKTKRHPVVGAETLVVGIDIGKRFHWVAFTVNGEQVKRFRIFNEGHSFVRLLSEIRRVQQRYGCQSVRIGMEPTGHYWFPLAYFLDKHRHPFVLVNPAHVKWSKELDDNSPLKSDPKDAGVIAELVRQGKYLHTVLPKGGYAHLRKLSAMRDQRLRKQSAHKNMLQRILDSVFPEFAGLFSDLLGKTSLALLVRYPSPQHLVRLGLNRLTRFIQKSSHGRLGRAKAEKVLEAAQNSIGLTEGLESHLLDLSQTLGTLALLAQQITEIEHQQLSYLTQIPYAAVLLSIPGVGPITVATLIGETGDLRAYASARALIKLAGLNLYEVSSGIHKGKRRITKRGRRRLRKALYCASLPLMRHTPLFQEKYQALRERGKAPQQALIALSVKLLRICFALVRTAQAFSREHILKQAA